MKIITLLLSTLLFVSTTMAYEYKSPITNVEVLESTKKSLSIQNLSNENIEMYILQKNLT